MEPLKLKLQSLHRGKATTGDPGYFCYIPRNDGDVPCSCILVIWQLHDTSNKDKYHSLMMINI